MVALLFADADEDRDVRAEVGPPFRSDRFFFFLFFSGRPNPIFPFRNLRKQREQNSSVQHPKRAQFECTEKPRCRKWPHLRDQRVNERLPSNAIFGRPRTGAGAEGVRERPGVLQLVQRGHVLLERQRRAPVHQLRARDTILPAAAASQRRPGPPASRR